VRITEIPLVGRDEGWEANVFFSRKTGPGRKKERKIFETKERKKERWLRHGDSACRS